MFWEEDEDSDGNPPSEWPEWKIQQHLRYCCYFCKDPDTFECEEQCKTCHQRACLECVRGCDECEEQGNCYEEGECYAPRFCDGCRAKELISQPCDPERKLCAACASWHFEDDLPTGHRCHLCYTERWRCRRDLVRMVEHCLLLSLKGRAAPRDDAPKATRVLDRLACEGHETLASVVLNFSVEGRPEGPRRRRRKLTAGKSTSGKAPRKQLATKAAHRRR